MKTRKEIEDKLDEIKDDSWEVLKDSHSEEPEINGVNRGAVYGWGEALEWVLQETGPYVELLSSRGKVTLEGEYDAMVASENNAKFRLTCAECGDRVSGTIWELDDEGWKWSFHMDTKTLEMSKTEAYCESCQEDKQEKEIDRDG